MKRSVLFTLFTVIAAFNLRAQVTQINSNKSLQPIVPLVDNKSILVSQIDSSIWVTDATLAGTVQITTDIKFEYTWGLLDNKMIFRGSTPATGSEVYITDGTPGGTVLVSDIVGGPAGSEPAEMVLMNGFLYFTAATPAEGRELWRTNGTPAGTTLVKDIVPGPDSSNTVLQYNLYSNGTYLLFAAQAPAAGIELWTSNGTNAGTVLVSDIHAGADSSSPGNFFSFNGMVLFTATNALNGREIWRTNGTPGGTNLVKDINPGVGSSTGFTIEPIPGIVLEYPIFLGFHVFNNRAYFNATDGTTNGEVWGTDGTEANTTLLKSILPGNAISNIVLLLDAINLPGKFIFPVTDGTTRSELWESDGTPDGTQLFMAFDVVENGIIPLIYVSFGVNQASGTLTYPLFQGNKFFFSAGTVDEGNEMYISDGTVAGTQILKDINPGGENGVTFSSYIYTTTTFFFAANDGTLGNELWQTDGTEGGTQMVFDINPNAGDADPQVGFIAFGKIIFPATDGDDADNTDLYVLDGTFTPLPLELSRFTVAPAGNDAILRWTTLREENTKDFTIQRSDDGQSFSSIGTVQAAGSSTLRKEYAYTDAGILNSGKSIVYYRLVSSDKDGRSTNSKVISLRINGVAQWSVRLLANPVRDQLTLLLSGITENVKLSIRDMTGKTLYTNSIQTLNGQISLPAQSLQRGTYVLVAETSNERKAVKFIKQ